MRRTEFANLQRCLVKIGARVVATATRVRIAFASAFPDKTLFVDVLRQLMDMPLVSRRRDKRFAVGRVT